MNKFKIKTFAFYLILILSATALFLVACKSKSSGDYYPDGGFYYGVDTGAGGNEYKEIDENPVTLVSAYPISRFSMDCNTAAYSNIRRAITDGRQIVKNQVRIEEMINYFHYDYDEPDEGKPLSCSGWISPCPWNTEANLLTVGLKAKEVEFGVVQNNLVFLLDVSGSMGSADKIELMQAAFCILSENLKDEDTVSIVTYAGASKTLLDGEKGADRLKIQRAIEDLTAGGSTAGAQGIQKAYELAEKHFIPGGNNRVILATDGDFNVGISSETELKNFISEKRGMGVSLSILGFGYGNLKDNKMQTLAAAGGDSNYFYIDSLLEARRVLADEIGGTLITVAKDVKAQVEFNPAHVYSYRLLGYENKLLSQAEWEDETKDAGDIGSGHCVTAVYEIVLNEDPLAVSSMGGNYLQISVKYNDPETNAPQAALIKYLDGTDVKLIMPNDDVEFISCVVEAALVMRDSIHKGAASLASVISRLQGIAGLSADPYKSEFLALMQKLKTSGWY